ncbi:prolipoprotein diacylglyceryl transferase, partial [candidate division GN15 bacterium]|nr:prolipoprotein diacylglyceryl transferase [candidate division GN15 bacterium]
LLIYTQWRLWKTNARLSPGRISGEFLVLYAILRIIGEQFREPDAALILGMSRGVFYSLFLILLGAAIIIKSRQTSLETLD